MKPALYYLYESGEPIPRLAEWPELGTHELVEAESLYVENFCMGFRVDVSYRVYAMRRGSHYGLSFLRNLTEGGLVVALYGDSLCPSPVSDVDWHRELDALASLRGFIVCDFERHDVCAALGRKAFWDGIDLLQIATGYLRGPGVQASDEAMRTEITLSRAIESLCKNGYRTPKK